MAYFAHFWLGLRKRIFKITLYIMLRVSQGEIVEVKELDDKEKQWNKIEA